MNLNDVFKEDFLESFIREDLMFHLEYVDDEELQNALRKVIAFYSVPGEYEDGNYD